MKIRIKFEKQGQMKFIGHLDIMRYFQKAIRRAEIDICYSEGFSPHQKMSFASPLGVGILSKGEYFDIDVNSSESSTESINKLNSVMVEGMKVTSYKKLNDNEKNCMSAIAAADYLVHFVEDKDYFGDSEIVNFMNENQIVILKKTKKSEKEIDIKPLIYDLKINSNGLFMKLASGSANNLKPELVIEALCNYLNKPTPKAVYERVEMYTDIEKDGAIKLISLESIGEIIE